ncbi:MAG: FAD-dependent monooxygenase [Chloroflexaceae bacterium]|nr:FAD-dependent monooxygenase [Chloroflexaceae bacterium]
MSGVFENNLQHPSRTANPSTERDTFDVIVVGARIAGSATATLLAQQGAEVLLLDRATFPAPTVSCPIFHGNSMRILEKMGVLADIEALDVPRIRRYGIRTEEFDLVARLPRSNGRDYAYSIRRDVMDNAIMQRIRTYPGITVREGFSVTGLVWANGRVVGVRGRQNGKAEQTFYARAVVGADGKRSIVAREVGAEKYAAHPNPSCIYYAYYRNFESIGEPSAVVYASVEDREKAVLVFDADNGLTVVSVGVPAARFDEYRKDPEATLETTWRSFPEVAERGRNAERVTSIMGQGPMDSYYRQSYGPGWVLVGDAGHYIDPITGQGINYALRGPNCWPRLGHASISQGAGVVAEGDERVSGAPRCRDAPDL